MNLIQVSCKFCRLARKFVRFQLTKIMLGMLHRARLRRRKKGVIFRTHHRSPKCAQNPNKTSTSIANKHTHQGTSLIRRERPTSADATLSQQILHSEDVGYLFLSHEE